MHIQQKFSEEQLLALVAQNNEAAIAELLNRNKNKFYTAAYLLVKDRYIAEDIFQEACVKIIRSIRNAQYVHDGRFMQWSLRIVRNLCYDYLRVAKRTPKVTLPDGKDIFSVLHFEEKNAEDIIMRNQSGNRIRMMLDLLPYEQREVLVLRMYGNLSFKEIATLTQVSINTALGRMRYGLLNLRKMVEEKSIAL
jgi:RNA polymerase, sigma subunit, ECF family